MVARRVGHAGPAAAPAEPQAEHRHPLAETEEQPVEAVGRGGDEPRVVEEDLVGLLAETQPDRDRRRSGTGHGHHGRDHRHTRQPGPEDDRGHRSADPRARARRDAVGEGLDAVFGVAVGVDGRRRRGRGGADLDPDGDDPGAPADGQLGGDGLHRGQQPGEREPRVHRGEADRQAHLADVQRDPPQASRGLLELVEPDRQPGRAPGDADPAHGSTRAVRSTAPTMCRRDSATACRCRTSAAAWRTRRA